MTNKTSIINNLKRKKIINLLNNSKRIDGRDFLESRSISIDVDVVSSANGSACINLGDASVVTGIKIQPDKPFPDLGDKGIFICTAEMLPLSHSDVEPGPPTDDAVELARVVDRGIRESHMIDLSKLVLEKDKSVIGIFVDNDITNYDGSMFDACSYASIAAIFSSTMPKWEIKNDQPSIIDGQESNIPTNTIPVSITMALIDGHIIVDPNSDEYACMDARITIITNSDGNICAIQKGGDGGFTYDQLIKCGEIAISAGTKIRKILKQYK